MNDLQTMQLEQLQALRIRVGQPLQERIDAELRRRRDQAQRDATRRDTVHHPATDRAEKEIQADIRRRLVAIGCTVYWLSQPRETMQTKGVPDLAVFGPAASQFAFIEVKAPGGKIRREQSEFKARCTAAGIDHVLGGLAEVAAHYGFEIEEPER